MTVLLERLIQTFPIRIDPTFQPHFTPGDCGPRSVVAGSRTCDLPPFEPATPGWGAGFNEPRSGGALHEAQDIPAAYGASVVATCPGTVVNEWIYMRARRPEDRRRSGAGYRRRVAGYVRVITPDGYVIYYAHMFPVWVDPGQPVRTGDLLGGVYHAGIRSGPNPPHLHFQIRRPAPHNPGFGGRAIDSFPRLRALKAAGQWRSPRPPLLANPYYGSRSSPSGGCR